MSTPIKDERSALEDLLESCYGAIYAYGVIAAYMADSDPALNAMAAFRKHRDELLSSFAELGLTATPARAAYALNTKVVDEPSARAAASLLEENAIAHWANALIYLPKLIQPRESKFLQECAIRSFSWSGIATAFSSASLEP